MHASIDPGACPGGLIAVLHDAAGEILEQTELEDIGSSEAVDFTAVRHADWLRAHRGSVAIYDGDSGLLIVVVTMDAIVAFPRSSPRFN